MTRFSLRCAFLGLLASLCACVSSRGARPAPNSPPLSRPNHASVYYYTVGAYFQSQDNIPGAVGMYRKAEENDPRSPRIKKSILLNSVKLQAAGLLEDTALKDLVRVYSTQMEFDEEMLYALYGFYDQTEDAPALARTMQALQQRPPSARTEIQSFLYAFKHLEREELGHLDAAFHLAYNDPDILINLAQLYLYFDLGQTEAILRRVNELAPSAQSHGLLASILLNLEDESLATAYLESLNYPDDAQYIESYLDTAFEVRKFDPILSGSDYLLRTGDPGLIRILGLTSLLRGEERILAKIAAWLPGSLAPQEDLLPLRAVLLAWEFNQGGARPLDADLALIPDTAGYDDAFNYYNASLITGAPEGGAVLPPTAGEALLSQLGLRLRDEPPARYLKALVHTVEDSTYTGYIEAKHDLVQYLKQRGNLAARDYQFLLQYYQDRGRKDRRRALLDEAAALYPYDPLFANDLGYSLLIEGGDPRQAAELIQRALDSEPENPYYLDSMAWSLYLAGDYARALEYCQIPAAMEDLPAEIAWHIGAIHLKLQNYSEARIFLEKCLAIGGDPDSEASAREALNQLPR